MRDPARIPVLLAKLKAYWEKNPDLRLGQIIVKLTPPNEDVFFVEDDVLIVNFPQSKEST